MESLAAIIVILHPLAATSWMTRKRENTMAEVLSRDEIDEILTEINSGDFIPEEFIAIDFETATDSPESAISIGLVKYRDFRPIGSYYSLIRPPKLYIRPDFTDIHGLTLSDVENAPTFRYLWNYEIGRFWQAPLAAHHAEFDMRVLSATLAFYNISPPNISYFCSCELARQVWPALPSHALSALAKEFNISYRAHNALDDADTCARIISLCAGKISEKAGIKETLPLNDILSKSGIKLKWWNKKQEASVEASAEEEQYENFRLV